MINQKSPKELIELVEDLQQKYEAMVNKFIRCSQELAAERLKRMDLEDKLEDIKNGNQANHN